MTFKNILNTHLKKYPKHEHADIYKLIFQSVFAGGHLIKNEKQHFARLIDEMALVKNNKQKALERISCEYSRIYIDGLIKTSLTPETLHKMIINSAHQNHGDMNVFKERLNVWKELEKDHTIVAFLDDMNAKKYPLVHHSEIYKKHYHPAYRIITNLYAFYFGLLTKIDEMLKYQERVIIAIDGDAGAGKSTLANLLNGLYEATIIKMDDFFLQDQQRSDMRLKEIGGNIDYERFVDEVVLPLSKQKPFSYKPYNCQTKTFDHSINVKNEKLIIVEGSYSLHDKFFAMYDLKVFLSVDPKIQHERLLMRNGGKMINRFINEWIPKEKAYAHEFQVKQKANLVYDTSSIDECLI